MQSNATGLDRLGRQGFTTLLAHYPTTGHNERKNMTTKTRASAIGDLVTMEGRASSWHSVKAGYTMYIYHYSTLMAEVTDTELVQVSLGWGSVTDKCGLAKLRSSALRNGLETRVEIRD